MTPDHNPNATMPATATQTTLDPSAIESEIEDLEARRNRLREKMTEIGSDLSDARSALQTADGEEDEEKALSTAEALQVRHNTVSEALTEVETDLEMLRDDLAEAKAAHRREEKLEDLSELGREAIEARADYEEVRAEIVAFLKERAPELAARFSAWLDAAEKFRSALRREERGVYGARSTSKADEARAEELIEELKHRGVTPFLRALAPFKAGGEPHLWKGWERAEDGPAARLKDAVESVRVFGSESAQSDE